MIVRWNDAYATPAPLEPLTIEMSTWHMIWQFQATRRLDSPLRRSVTQRGAATAAPKAGACGETVQYPQLAQASRAGAGAQLKLADGTRCLAAAVGHRQGRPGAHACGTKKGQRSSGRILSI